MNIRAKITITFFGIVTVVLTAITFSIYFFSANYRQEDFYRRLKNRAINTASVLMQVEEVNADLLKRMERNNPASLPNQYIIIYDHQNRELYSSEGKKVIAIDTVMLSQIRLEEEIRYATGNFEVLGFLFTDKNDRFTVVAAATDVYGLDALSNLRNILITTFCISIVSVSLLGWVYAGKVLRPILKIVNDVSKITEVNLSQGLDEGNRKDELGKLAQTFNNMLERLQRAFSAQKNFIANASHEIGTPITIMSGEIEVALLQHREKDYYINVLKSVLASLRGLNKLSSQLLLLAQTSAEQPVRNFALIRIDDILWEAKKELVKIHPEYSINIQFDIALKHESLLVNGDEQLVKVAIFNLMDNGCKYADDKRVIIRLDSKDPHMIAINFINKGPGIDPHSIDRIFDPFYRGNNKKKVKGSGIGLSLADRIMSLHNGKIAVESTPATERTCFTIAFPIRKV